jgi:cephalosporin-C deacetylase-like acetyl esterase
MSRHVYVSLWVMAYLAACFRAGAAEKPADFERFWRQAFVQVQSRPANPAWQPDVLTFAGPGLVPCRMRCHLEPESELPPVLYLLDRAGADDFMPSKTHSWLVLDVGGMWSEADIGPEPTHHPMYATVLTAQRALGLLLQRTQPGHTRAGLVGEGRGGGAALALAALSPDDVAFVAAHQPLPGPRYADEATGVPTSPELHQVEARYHRFREALPGQIAYFDLPHFATGIKCPTLLSYGGNDGVVGPAEVMALYEVLTCDKELAEFPRARHCQAKDLQEWWGVWREWAADILG